MRVAWRDHYGPSSEIEVIDTATPVLGDDDVLVRVRATTVSRTDCALLAGTPFVMRLLCGFPRPNEYTLGTDFAGEIEAVGRSVTKFSVGERVWGFNDMGARSQAEYLAMSADGVITTMPKNVNFEDAVACIEGAFYAQNFINKVRIDPGTRVMINGATGAIGSALLQLSKNLRASVTAVGDTGNLELLRSLGADRVINYLHEDFTQDSETYNHVFDAVGKSTFGKCKRLLAPKGVYISSELGPGAQNLFLALVTPAFGRRKVVFPFPSNIRGFLGMMTGLVESARFRPVIDRSYTLDSIRAAYAYAASGQKTGSVILKP